MVGTTVFNYMKAHRRGGLGALNLRHSPGHPRRLTPDQERHTIDVVTQHVRQEVGFPAEMNWTAPLVARYGLAVECRSRPRNLQAGRRLAASRLFVSGGALLGFKVYYRTIVPFCVPLEEPHPKKLVVGPKRLLGESSTALTPPNLPKEWAGRLAHESGK